MRIAIFEDDESFARKLERIIQIYTHDAVSLNTNRNDELIGYIGQAAQPTLFFLDIMTNGIADGFTLADHIHNHACGHLVVFITAYPGKIIGNPPYLTKAFSLIFKDSPVLQSEVCATIDLAQSVMKKHSLLIHKGRLDSLYIPMDSIYFIENIKCSDKVCIHCKNGQFIIRCSLGSLLDNLDERFVRCHHSFIVNLQNILRINKTERTVHFPDGLFCSYSYLKRGNLF